MGAEIVAGVLALHNFDVRFVSRYHLIGIGGTIKDEDEISSSVEAMADKKLEIDSRVFRLRVNV